MDTTNDNTTKDDPLSVILGEMRAMRAEIRSVKEGQNFIHDKVSRLEERKAAKKAARNLSIKVSVEISEKVEPTPKVDPVPVAEPSSDTVEASTKPAEVVEAVAEVAPQSPQQQSATEEKAALRPTGSAKSVSELISLFGTPAKTLRGASRAEGKPQAQITISSEYHFGASKSTNNNVKYPRGDLRPPDPIYIFEADTRVSTAPAEESVSGPEECHTAQEAKREPVDDHKSPGGLGDSFGPESGGIFPRGAETSVGQCVNGGGDAPKDVPFDSSGDVIFTCDKKKLLQGSSIILHDEAVPYNFSTAKPTFPQPMPTLPTQSANGGESSPDRDKAFLSEPGPPADFLQSLARVHAELREISSRECFSTTNLVSDPDVSISTQVLSSEASQRFSKFFQALFVDDFDFPDQAVDFQVTDLQLI